MSKSFTTLGNLYYRSSLRFLSPADAKKLAAAYRSAAKQLFAVLIRHGYSSAEAKKLTIRFMEYPPDSGRRHLYSGNETVQRATREEVRTKVIEPFFDRLEILLQRFKPHHWDKEFGEIENDINLSPERKLQSRAKIMYQWLETISSTRAFNATYLPELKRNARAMGLQVVKPATHALQKGWIPNRKSPEVQALMRRAHTFGRRIIPRRKK